MAGSPAVARRAAPARVWHGSTSVGAIAFALTTLAALADALTRDHAVLIGLLIVGPLIAATGTTSQRTSAVAAYAVALGLLLGIPDGMFLTLDHLIRCSVLAVAGGLSVWAATLRDEREAALARVAHVAEIAQRAILRAPPPDLGCVRLAARYVSATEGALIGGDLYETAYTPHGVRVMLGDVRGKGLEAVGLGAAVVGRFREVVFSAATLSEVAVAIDEHVQATAGPEEFVTAVLCEFPDDGGVRIVNCGHHPPLLVGEAGGSFLHGQGTSLPLGLGTEPVIEEHDFTPGERILLYTDGLVEARDRDQRFFDLVAAAPVLRDATFAAALDDLLSSLSRHTGGATNDDLAVLLVERCG